MLKVIELIHTEAEEDVSPLTSEPVPQLQFLYIYKIHEYNMKQ